MNLFLVLDYSIVATRSWLLQWLHNWHTIVGAKRWSYGSSLVCCCCHGNFVLSGTSRHIVIVALTCDASGIIYILTYLHVSTSA